MKRSQKKIVVGITGSIGTGKTFVLNQFKSLGANTLNLDDVSRIVYKPKTYCWKKIIQNFGREILKDNSIDRKKLRNIVFKNKKKRRLLEKITHPFILEFMENWIKNNNGFLTVEVPLLFEKHLEKFFDYIITVYIPKKLQFKRLKNRFKKNTIDSIMDSFLPMSYKISKSDFVIYNYNKKDTKKDVKRIYEKIIK